MQTGSLTQWVNFNHRATHLLDVTTMVSYAKEHVFVQAAHLPKRRKLDPSLTSDSLTHTHLLAPRGPHDIDILPLDPPHATPPSALLPLPEIRTIGTSALPRELSSLATSLQAPLSRGDDINPPLRIRSDRPLSNEGLLPNAQLYLDPAVHGIARDGRLGHPRGGLDAAGLPGPAFRWLQERLGREMPDFGGEMFPAGIDDPGNAGYAQLARTY